MEFEHVGLHCLSCKRKDFLPIQCNTCSKSYCKECITNTGHLTVCQRRDMTSFDCPICGKSVKHDKAEDVNEIWSVHFATECTSAPTVKTSNQKTAAPVKNVLGSSSVPDGLCFYSQCRKHMGPSNRFRCSKCHKEVCLAHRMPEAHECASLSRKTAPSKPNVNMPTKSEAPKSLKQPAAVPMAGVEICPMCQQRFFKVEDLVSHFDRSHGEQQPTVKPTESIFTSIIGKWFK